jgi:TfoX/Sxy family transcriptional regulator of competence genes
MATMKWTQPSAETIAYFERIAPGPPLETRRMFGMPCRFLNGHMLVGVFQNTLMLHLSAEDREECLKAGATPFAPMGREMKEYVDVAPGTFDDREMKEWIVRGMRYLGSLEPKVPRVRNTLKSRAVMAMEAPTRIVRAVRMTDAAKPAKGPSGTQRVKSVSVTGSTKAVKAVRSTGARPAVKPTGASQGSRLTGTNRAAKATGVSKAVTTGVKAVKLTGASKAVTKGVRAVKSTGASKAVKAVRAKPGRRGVAKAPLARRVGAKAAGPKRGGTKAAVSKTAAAKVRRATEARTRQAVPAMRAKAKPSRRARRK